MSHPLEPTPSRFTNPYALYLAATRPPFLSATVAGCLLGMATALHDGVAWQTSFAIAGTLLALFTHAAANVLNDYYDALNGTDDLNTQRVYPFTGGSRFIQNGVLTLQQTARFGYVLLLLSISGGTWIVSRVGTGLLWLGAGGLLIVWAYSATPLKLNSRGLGELCVLLGFLGIVVGMDFVLRGNYSAHPVWLGLPYGLLVTNLLYINQFPDREADALAGKHHWVTRLPLPLAARGYAVLAGLALGFLGMSIERSYAPTWAWIAALPLGFSFAAAVVLRRHAASPARLLPAIRMTIAAMLSHGILLAAILVWNPA